MLTDLAMVTLVVHLTGGIDSSLNFLYPLVIIVACMLLPRSWGFLSGALAFILFGTVLELDYYGVIPSFSTSHPKLKALQVVMFVNLFAYFAIAYLAGLLVTKLRQADVRTERRKRCAAEPSGAARKHRAVDEWWRDRHRPRRPHYAGQPGRAATCWRRPRANCGVARSPSLFLDPLPHVGSGRSDAEVRLRVGATDFARHSG